MVAQCQNKSFNGRLVAIGCNYEPWIALLEQSGWKTHCCYDLRTADSILDEYSPCICIVDLSNNDFSLNSIALRANKTKHVKWIAVIKKEQLQTDAICQFINNFCVDYFSVPIPSNHLLETVGHQLGMLEIEASSWVEITSQHDMGLFGESKSIKQLRDMVRRVASTDEKYPFFAMVPFAPDVLYRLAEPTLPLILKCGRRKTKSDRGAEQWR